MPQPDEQPPAGQTRPAASSRAEATAPAGRPAIEPVEETATTPVGEATAESTPAGQAVHDDAPPTEILAPRWTGFAPVPAPTGGKRRQRFLDTEPELAPAPQRGLTSEPLREPTLELPTAERAALEDGPPADPWAGSGPWPAPGTPYPPGGTAATLPYPGPAPQPPAPPALPGPPAPPPVAPAPRRRGRRATPSPLVYGPPPGWRPPPGYVAVAVRRRRRWPWVLLALTLMTVACCCGLPAYLAKPMLEQYPATAALPAKVADLKLRDDAASKQAARRLEQQMRTAHPLAEGTFAGVYSAPGDKLVTVFGATGLRWSPDQDVDAEIARLTPTYGLTGLHTIKTRTRGEYLTCGTGRADGTGVVVCTWADHGSLGTALFTKLSLDDSVVLLHLLRTSIVTRG